jgi:uncharacterized membrane protein
MSKSFTAVLLAGAMALGACSTTPQEDATLRGAGTGAGVGAVAGAGVGAVVGGLNPIEGAAIGAAVGGLAGAVWADRDRDGYADGYERDGRYYEGRPTGYAETRSCPSTLAGAATGAGIGGLGGAGVGAVVDGINPLEGAAIGAVVGGIAGAVWADANNDGCIDGYRRDGRYYEGSPYRQTIVRRGERG